MMESPGGRFLTLKLLRALLSGKPPRTIPIPAFLIRHPSAGAILVDTGLHPSIATDGQENFGRLGEPLRQAARWRPAKTCRRSCASAASTPARSRSW